MKTIKKGLMAAAFLCFNGCTEERPSLLEDFNRSGNEERAIARIEKEFEYCDYLRVGFFEYSDYTGRYSGYDITCGENYFHHYDMLNTLIWENIRYDANNDGEVMSMHFIYPHFKKGDNHETTLFGIELNGEDATINMVYEDILNELNVQDVHKVWESRWKR